ncbi:MAG TPA: SpoVR family protein [Steroidobacteraceae bacterium]|nr:SpoVR family protein [Steroidobacteraceae bacterium]
MADGWRTHLHELETLARAEGLDYLPVDFEAVPDSLMMEIAIYGLPVRMPHWSFGVRYIYRLVQHRLGLSRLFEVVFPGNPGHAYLGRNNSDAENLLVVAHVLGHADFSANNLLFRRSASQVGEHIVEQAATHARQIAAAIEAHGADRVETVLDAALALEQHVDVDAPLRREPYPTEVARPPARDGDPFLQRFRALGPDVATPAPEGRRVTRAPVPPHPERDLLWFIAHHAPELEPWERDIFLAVREESFYFYPVFACQIMNEGWASYWHARLLREAKFLPQGVYVDAIKCHSDVVRPTATGDGVSLHINPYHIGFRLWDRIVERDGVEAARRIMQQDDDFAFIRGQLDAELAADLQLFHYQGAPKGPFEVQELNLQALHEAMLAPKYAFGAPTVAAQHVHLDGTLDLVHDHATDGRGLDVERSRRALDYLVKVWRRPIKLMTVDADGDAFQISADPA